MKATPVVAVAAAALAVVALAGCSQVEALAPVGGDHMTEVRFAALDVLVEQDVEILVAPVCRELEDESVSCAGTTVDDEPITVTSTAADSLEVKVGGAVLYSGTITAVIDDAIRPGS